MIVGSIKEQRTTKDGDTTIGIRQSHLKQQSKVFFTNGETESWTMTQHSSAAGSRDAGARQDGA